MLPVLVAVVIGAGLPMQTAINSRLRAALGSPMRSSLASFAVGTVALMAVLLLTGEGFGLSRGLLTSQPWWVWIGGVLGVAFLTGNIVLFPHLGGVRTVILPILGQILMGDVIDVLGLFGLPVRALTWRLVAGTVLAAAGMVMAVAAGAPGPRGDGDSSVDLSRDPRGAAASDDAGDEALGGMTGPSDGGSSRAVAGRSAGLVLWSVVGVLLGTLSAMQTAANGELGIRMGSAVRASVVSFVSGTALLALLVGAEGIWRIARRTSAPAETGERVRRRWWFWSGGLLGALFVYGNALLSPILGTGLTVVVVMVGQLAGSMAVDQFGLFGSPRRPVGPRRLVGVLVVLAGAAVMRL
ncbi:DMT family transporter [uncultured Bifidobacterium sp.]|uniref:DMT family transporter n=1 Tax=uncultured Bifidobacterium sp. TaxID=165187 RepID=UPI0028DB7E48|nr:DMT family transporter [uncultured Bifidobacterium sp.]